METNLGPMCTREDWVTLTLPMVLGGRSSTVTVWSSNIITSEPQLDRPVDMLSNILSKKTKEIPKTTTTLTLKCPVITTALNHFIVSKGSRQTSRRFIICSATNFAPLLMTAITKSLLASSWPIAKHYLWILCRHLCYADMYIVKQREAINSIANENFGNNNFLSLGTVISLFWLCVAAKLVAL